MPYPLQLFDPEAGDLDGVGISTIPLTVGGSSQAGDIRIFWVFAFTQTFSSFPGWTKQYDALTAGDRVGVFTKVMTGSDSDGTLTFAGTPQGGVYMAVTVRNPNLSQSFVPSTMGQATAVNSVAPSVTVAAGGIMLAFNFKNAGDITAQAPGMTLLAHDFGTFGVLLAAQSFTTAGSSGTKTAVSASANAYWAQSLALIVNPDVTFTMGTATTETDTESAFTMSRLTTTSFVMGTAQEADTGKQFFTPLDGYRISPPIPLPQSPITNSVIHWEQSTPAVGSTAKVETSVDGGATWQLAVSDQPVSRLLTGSNTWQSLLTKVTLHRRAVTDPSPSVIDLEVRVATDDSNDELVSLGLFSINNTNITITGGTTGGSSGSGGGGNGVTGSGGGNTGGGLSIEISGVDLSRSIARNSWEDVHFVPAGTNYAIAIHDIIEDRLPNTSYNFASTTHVTPKLIFGMSMDSDPWQDAQDLATAIGMELFFDALGVCTLRDVPDPGTGQSVWTFSDSANPTIASATRSLTDQTVFNYIVAYGESVDNAVPVSAVAFDDNPNSPTYYLGAYGKVPTSFTSAQIVTVEQAQAAADALLNLSIGNAENVEISVVPNPAIEPGDVVTVTIGELKLTGTFMVNDMNTPLSAAEAQTFTVYRQST